MDIQSGNIVQMKKTHPCGNNKFKVIRVGMDFKIRCMKCQRDIWLDRKSAEKNTVKILE